VGVAIGQGRRRCKRDSASRTARERQWGEVGPTWAADERQRIVR
jgi:hypothetical protein